MIWGLDADDRRRLLLSRPHEIDNLDLFFFYDAHMYRLNLNGTFTHVDTHKDTTTRQSKCMLPTSIENAAKLWLKSQDYAGMKLHEFLEATCNVYAPT